MRVDIPKNQCINLAKQENGYEVGAGIIAIYPITTRPSLYLNYTKPTPYRTGDRCGWCGNGAFIIGAKSAQCSNPRCANIIPLERS